MGHNEYDAYFANGEYGSPQAFYIKVPSNVVDMSEESKMNNGSMYSDIETYLPELNGDIALDIKKVIDSLIIDKTTLVNSYGLIENNLYSYNKLKNLGKESIPHVLNYVIQSDNNGMFEAFLIASVAEMLNLKSLPGSIESSDKYLCEYQDYSPKYYAYQILICIFCNNSM